MKNEELIPYLQNRINEINNNPHLSDETKANWIKPKQDKLFELLNDEEQISDEEQKEIDMLIAQNQAQQMLDSPEDYGLI